MKKKLRLIGTVAAAMCILWSCKKDNDETTVDNHAPVIDLTGDAFPVQCSTLKRGGSFIFKTKFSDNVELGTYSIDIHHNFDHHTHSTEFEECELQPKKEPVKPFLFIKSYDIPSGQKNYEAVQQIEVPADIDPGDYHFMISISDHVGWSTIKGLSIQIVE
ncbi:DUF4625 domain-containing protein [Sphingobacterium sp. DN00404]|uniref:DUF4625 domain-containing protein n=1 Tax=Sphingobacterium micropteri TaxID=2763501 RepID=A0ABR7YNZ8_9SPHI|nr:DUF4625 domain-containing protein [Sphingobacterium micropteri]MBD1432994.1 DUF4625 domain-containing protein [Sphingobacterium micropteri]